jgi:alpha,alpha-trehalase
MAADTAGRRDAEAAPARVSAGVAVDALPDALAPGELESRADGRRPAVFLDYDGTLTPIVARPEQAVIPADVAAALADLATVATVAIVSGRDLLDVAAMVGVEGLWYAGSHGFDVRSPDGSSRQFEAGSAAGPALDAAERDLAGVLRVDGAWTERKRFAIAVHHRATPDHLVPGLAEAVAEVAAAHPELRVTGGKKIIELRPDVAWDKGRALTWLLGAAGVDPDREVAVFVGDDETDEDALAVVRDHGIGVVVAAGDDTDSRPTAAHLRLSGPGDAAALLGRLAALARTAEPRP